MSVKRRDLIRYLEKNGLFTLPRRKRSGLSRLKFGPNTVRSRFPSRIPSKLIFLCGDGGPRDRYASSSSGCLAGKEMLAAQYFRIVLGESVGRVVSEKVECPAL